MRYLLGIAMLLFGLVGPSFAQTATDDAPWQAAVTSQIEAFRAHDGAAALEYAGLSFKAAYPDPEAFYADIVRGGYEPIVNSRSHTFGKFEMVNETTVMQVVKFVGPDFGLYEALYQVGKEDDGWRVLGVALRHEQGVGV